MKKKSIAHFYIHQKSKHPSHTKEKIAYGLLTTALGRLCNAYRDALNPFMPTGAFNICCPRDCVSRHNGGTSGAPLKPLRVDSALAMILGVTGLFAHGLKVRIG